MSAYKDHYYGQGRVNGFLLGLGLTLAVIGMFAMLKPIPQVNCGDYTQGYEDGEDHAWEECRDAMDVHNRDWQRPVRELTRTPSGYYYYVTCAAKRETAPRDWEPINGWNDKKPPRPE